VPDDNAGDTKVKPAPPGDKVTPAPVRDDNAADDDDDVDDDDVDDDDDDDDDDDVASNSIKPACSRRQRSFPANSGSRPFKLFTLKLDAVDVVARPAVCTRSWPLRRHSLAAARSDSVLPEAPHWRF